MHTVPVIEFTGPNGDPIIVHACAPDRHITSAHMKAVRRWGSKARMKQATRTVGDGTQYHHADA